MDNLDTFIGARDYLVQNIDPTIQAYLCNIWDPLARFIIAREINSILSKDLLEKFPELPKCLQPRFKYRVHEEPDKDGDGAEIEINIQKYICTDRNLEYLGAIGMGSVLYDLYYRNAYDGTDDKYFIARYGHLYDNYFSGTKAAEAEYYMGQFTPLSVAYGMAINDGII